MQRLFLLAAAGGLIASLPGCGSGGDPFAYVPVSGKVTYDDGSKIPHALVVRFLPQSPPRDQKTWARMGTASVDAQTGEYKSVTSHRFGDGLVPGKHKATLAGVSGKPLPANVVPPEYTNFDKTPLVVDTADKESFNLKIRKPAKK